MAAPGRKPMNADMRFRPRVPQHGSGRRLSAVQPVAITYAALLQPDRPATRDPAAFHRALDRRDEDFRARLDGRL
jgi:hypothetical protein